jgi:hypothetical protein
MLTQHSRSSVTTEQKILYLIPVLVAITLATAPQDACIDISLNSPNNPTTHPPPPTPSITPCE